MKFSTTRRGILALLGAAPAAPLAAKAIIDKELASLSGVSGHTLAGAVGGPYSSEPPSMSPSDSGVDVYETASEFVNLFGLPEHTERQMWRASRRVEYFDPDIVAKRTWSNSVKILTQRERNFSAMRERVKDEAAEQRKIKAFRKLSGFNWPYYY